MGGDKIKTEQSRENEVPAFGRGELFFLSMIGIEKGRSFIAAGMMFLSTVFEGLSMALLVPLIKYLTTGEVSVVWEAWGMRSIKKILPNLPFIKKPLTVLLVLLLGAVIAKNFFSYEGILIAARQARAAANRLRQRIFDRFLSCEKAFFDRWGQSFLQQVLVGFVSEVARETVQFSRVVQAFFTLAIYCAVMVFVSWPLTIACFLFFPPMYFISNFITQKIKATAREYTKTYVTLGHKIANALNCILLVKSYCNEKAERQWFDFTNDRLMKLENSMDKKRWAIAPMNEIMSTVAITALLAGVSLFFARAEPTQVSGYLVFFLVLKRSVTQFSLIREFFGNLAQIKGHVQKIEELFNERAEDVVSSGPKEFKGLNEAIQFKQLTFSYIEREDVLQNVSFEIKKGEKIALVGATGSGKTTLASLLMRFYEVPPQTILIDGVDIREYSLGSLRRRIAMVSQDPFILNASFRLNLTYGLSRKVGEEEIGQALRIARLDGLVEMLGLDFEIGERGVKLSGGEKQRLSIARAILKKAEILILDEATSALDSETEKLVQEALDTFIYEKTLIAIAHRLSTIKNVDRIMVLEEGKIVEQGSLQELLALKGKFYQSWSSQQFF